MKVLHTLSISTDDFGYEMMSFGRRISNLYLYMLTITFGSVVLCGPSITNFTTRSLRKTIQILTIFSYVMPYSCF